MHSTTMKIMLDVFSLCIVVELSSTPTITNQANSLPHDVRHAHPPAGINFGLYFYRSIKLILYTLH
jgi:hypothetical protein